MRVVVKGKISRGGCFYECQLTPRGYKCGRCLRGIVVARQNDLCRVCGCRVAQVVEDDGFIKEGWPMRHNV